MDHFTPVLPDLTYDAGVSDGDALSPEFAPVPNGSAHDEKILSFCYFQAREAPEIAARIGVADSGYFRKKLLDHSVNCGYPKKSKNGRAVYFKTVPAMVRVN